MYHGIPGDSRNLGIKPTKADHSLVSAWSLMGIGVREICVRLGEKYHLGKPMSRMTLYWHFRKDLKTWKPGPKVSDVKRRLSGKPLGRPREYMDRKPVKKGMMSKSISVAIQAEMQQLIDEARKRAKKKQQDN